MNIADVIGWKFNYQAGMRCKEIDGVMTIIEFPDGVPSIADQDLWTLEYEAEKELNDLANAKQSQKDQLARKKIESMLTVEFAEIDAATTKAAAKAVTIK